MLRCECAEHALRSTNVDHAAEVAVQAASWQPSELDQHGAGKRRSGCRSTLHTCERLTGKWSTIAGCQVSGGDMSQLRPLARFSCQKSLVAGASAAAAHPKHSRGYSTPAESCEGQCFCCCLHSRHPVLTRSCVPAAIHPEAGACLPLSQM